MQYHELEGRYGWAKFVGILPKKVLSDVDEGARSAIVGEFVDKGFSLLDKALESCRAGFAKADCRYINDYSNIEMRIVKCL